MNSQIRKKHKPSAVEINANGMETAFQLPAAQACCLCEIIPHRWSILIEPPQSFGDRQLRRTPCALVGTPCLKQGYRPRREGICRAREAARRVYPAGPFRR